MPCIRRLSVFAVQYHRYGGPEVLRVEEVDEPHAGPGQIRIAVRATGVTPADWYLRSGMLRDIAAVDFPHIPGMDAAGIVFDVGEGVAGSAVRSFPTRLSSDVMQAAQRNI